jgi:Fe-S cluster assembly iron-binding protein IscA
LGLAQGEPQYGDVTIEKDGRTFAVEREIADVVNYLEIDYYKGWLRKGFSININGRRSSC